MLLIIKFIAGLGIFLYGMRKLEYSCKKYCSTPLKNFLLTKTNSPVQSVSSGALITALVQSSSLVGLTALALCSAGLLPLVNAIGIMIGANLGTTLTGWLIALIDFEFNIIIVLLIFFGLVAVIGFFIAKEKTIKFIHLLLGFCLLLLGLELMRNATQHFTSNFNSEFFHQHSSWYFFIIGICLSAIVQSSSAVMLMALNALNFQFIQLEQAAAILIGADLGTTSTVILGSVYGKKIKRILASAHFIFNLVTDLVAFFLLLPFLPSLLVFLNITEPLIGLVFFHSFFNLVGLLLFFPWLKNFADFLNRCWKNDRDKNQQKNF